MTKRYFPGLCFFVLLMCGPSLSAQVILEYSHTAEDRWHVTSIVDQEVIQDGLVSYQAEILNKISVEVLRGNGGDGLLSNIYSIAENQGDGSGYAWSAEYNVQYGRDRLGRISGLPAGSPVPTVRNMPVFPDTPVAPGGTWTAPGREVFDMDPTFGIPELAVVDFDALYRYEGEEVFEERSLHRLEITYGYNWTPPRNLRSYPVYPIAISGEFLENVLWDAAAGRNYVSEGEYSYVFTLSDGRRIEFRGQSHGRAYYVLPMDRGSLVDEIADTTDFSAEATDDGVRITLEDIRFLPDRAVMLEGEEKKLAAIAEILAAHPNRDILVVGHTARVGTSDGQVLSEQRAAAVARYFVKRGIRLPSQVLTRGMGYREPVGDNATEEGRRRNRRVEITILEN